MGEDTAGLDPNGELRLESGIREARQLAPAEMGWPIAGALGRFER